MQALEDAFEALHVKAEVVSQALRERGAGLLVASQARTGRVAEARLGTPCSQLGGGRGWDESEGDEGEGDGGDGDGGSELWPDDSASNFSRSRVRRPKRRAERRVRTPGVVEEGDEEGEGV